ncbi:replication-associated protein [Avon-Heathcote Estuary associated circular virus 20]|uniref:replication-associated protein n=1 Tax=Avon-Heathcote Estuary associated circular virus 20 TaxID=1618244 RepID=UPI0005CD8D25|nr:replication-associated protein [Avon-Heathcote Estuary associated circular virus 20]AJP36448.1 replication-associated protein [Avon-Heathcote Estuary associated circular virus 20]AJP36449.1 replication-associated protein [Avon-Heathcote Estuary associated circular virus 20]
MSRIRNMMVTIYFEDNGCPDPPEIRAMLGALPNLRYYIGQMEKCPSTGRFHFQGYIEFDSAMYVKKISAQLNNCHIEARKGTQLQAIAYCKKHETRVGNWIEYGERAKQGTRSDLDDVAECIYGGKSIREIQEEHPRAYMMYSKGIKDLYYTVNNIEPRSEPPVVIYCYGQTGTGKSRYAKRYSDNVYFKNMSCKWWDGYNGQDVVVFDDIRGDTFKYHELLRILDRYVRHECDSPNAPMVGIPCMLNIRGAASTSIRL